MSKEQVLTWLFNYGREWVDWDTAHRLMAGILGQPEREGYLDMLYDYSSPRIRYRLSDKALKLLEEV
jgi:hypothetical protein